MSDCFCEAGKIGITILASGSAGNATLVQCGEDAILVDAGISLKELKCRLAVCQLQPKLSGILVTHEHSDHVHGLRVISNYFNAPIFTTRMCCDALLHLDPKLEKLKIFAPGGEFALGGFKVCPFPIPHDAVDAMAYTLERDSKKLAIATDMGRITKMMEFQLKGCDALVLESNHDKQMLAASTRPWSLKMRILGPGGHLSNNQFSELLASVIAPQTKKIALAHISRDCNTYDLAEQNARQCLMELHRPDVELYVARQDIPTKTFWI